jgi:hypothetical protein
MRIPRFTLIDLIAVVTAAAVGLGWVAWAAPGRSGPAMIVIGPLVGILWQRGRGGRGILGGLLGGAAYALSGLVLFATGPHGTGSPSMSTMANWPIQVFFMTAVCLVFGTVLGIVAWLASTAMRPWGTPDPLRLRD